METQIQIKINNKEKEIIKRASRLLTIGHSTFCRQASLKEAYKILKENGEEISN